MTILETYLLEVLTREAVRFCSRAVRLFSAPLAPRGGGGGVVLSYISYMGICRCEVYGFQAV